MQQASRVAEFTGFFLLGKLIEFDKTEKIFTNPTDKRRKITSPEVWINQYAQPISPRTRRTRARLLRMGGLANRPLTAPARLHDRDLKRCPMVLEGETQINLVEREIDEMSFDLLAMQQPMAVDLRFILAVSKINADFGARRRSGSEHRRACNGHVELQKVDLPVDIPRMATRYRQWVASRVGIVHRRKGRASAAVLEMDNVVDP